MFFCVTMNTEDSAALIFASCQFVCEQRFWLCNQQFRTLTYRLWPWHLVIASSTCNSLLSFEYIPALFSDRTYIKQLMVAFKIHNRINNCQYYNLHEYLNSLRSYSLNSYIRLPETFASIRQQNDSFRR